MSFLNKYYLDTINQTYIKKYGTKKVYKKNNWIQ